MYIAIGKIIQLHGIRGYVKAVAYSGVTERFLALKTLYVELDDGTRGLILEDILLQQNSTLLKFKNIDSREEAAPFVGKDLLVPQEQKIDLPEDVYFIHDLIGLQVFDIEGNYLGVLQDVFVMAGNDVYQVKRGGEEILIPAVSEFVKEITLTERKMIVKTIEGLSTVSAGAPES